MEFHPESTVDHAYLLMKALLSMVWVEGLGWDHSSWIKANIHWRDDVGQPTQALWASSSSYGSADAIGVLY